MRVLIILFILLTGYRALAQDSVRVVADSVRKDSVDLVLVDTVSAEERWDSARAVVIGMSRFKLTAPGWFFFQRDKQLVGRERMFYFIVFVFLFFGIIRQVYPRYFKDIFRYYFQSTLRVNQVREQLTLSVLAGFFFNLLFFVSAGIFLYLLAVRYHLSFRIPASYLPFLTILLLTIVYGLKYFFVMMMGWIFHIRKAAGLYLFIIFLTNKIIGVTLLPFLAAIAFAPEGLADVFLNISVTFLLSLFCFRFIRAYQPLREEFRIGVFPYISYLIAFEIAPLMLIYKALMGLL
jgi:hypothetical protein